MEILNHPFWLLILIILSLISSYLCWIGMRKRDVPAILWGIGTAVPTFGIQDYRLWGVGVGVCVAGWWVYRRLNSI